jgi:ABC-2 type transport system ATP-binding protein
MQKIIQTEDLTKYFDDLLAVDHISFDIKSGELFGLLGPNGAGKTTTIKMLTGLAKPSSGRAVVAGIDIRKHPKEAQWMMGVVPDESNLYPELTGFENLNFCAALYGMARQERRRRSRELLKMFDLSDAADRKFGDYSKGMKRKLTIAAGIIHHPPLLFLDEPTTGIDVTSARQIRQLIMELRKCGTTILLTTHYIEEAERLCDRIAFIVKGRIIQIDSVANLLQPMQDMYIMDVVLSDATGDLLPATVQHFPDYQVEMLPGEVMRFTSHQPIIVSPIINFLEEHEAQVLEARRKKPSLEDVFVKLTGVDKDAMLNGTRDKGGRI